MTHSWCRDLSRDEAVRAVEDGRTGPLPTLEEAIAVVTDRRPVQPGGGGNVTGLRTERVTLEVTYRWMTPPSAWNWNHVITSPLVTLKPGESVRVVEETHFDDLAQVSMECDAAIRERDAAKSDAEKSAVRIKSQAENVAYFRRDRDETVSERDAAIRERDALKARVAELEADVADCNILFGDRWREAVSAVTGKAAPAASGAAGTVPVAWGILRGGHFIVATVNEIAANESCKDYGGTVVPLYAAPQPAKGWLTAEEREAVAFAARKLRELANQQYRNGDEASATDTSREADFLDGLLARSTPPEVVLPQRWSGMRSVVGDQRDAEWHAALAAAGVPWKEVGK
jgi:hypothetical protein